MRAGTRSSKNPAWSTVSRARSISASTCTSRAGIVAERPNFSTWIRLASWTMFASVRSRDPSITTAVPRRTSAFFFIHGRYSS
jgi:hypothetical protein